MKSFLLPILIFFGGYCYATTTGDTPATPMKFSWVDETALTAKVDFLYWQTQEGGLDYVYTDAITSGTFYGGRGDIHPATFDWHPGFRASMNYCFNYDYWKIGGQYGNFVPNGTQRMTPLAGQTMTGTFPQSTGTSLSQATSDISLRIHFADLFLGKAFQISKNIMLNFINGLTGVWMKQNWDVTYEGSQPNGNRENVKPKWRFKGAGVKTGFEIDWQMGWGFTWNGKSTISGMFGNYDNRMYLFTTNLSTMVRTVLQNTHYDDFRIVPVIQLAMGPSWQKTFKRWGMKITANYELNTFINVHQVNRDEFYSQNNSNPQTRTVNAQLQMDGLTLTLLFSF